MPRIQKDYTARNTPKTEIYIPFSLFFNLPERVR
jgi:hypothetical protein